MNLERIILETLENVHPRMLTDRVLLGDVRLQESSVSQGDLTRALRILENKKQVIVLTGEDSTRVKITQAGQARLLE